MKKTEKRPYRSHGDGTFQISSFKSIGANVIFENGSLVFHPENILLGNNIYIGHNTILKGYYKNTLTIGDDVWIGQGCFFHAGGGLHIGHSVGVGPMVKIITSVHEDHDLSIPLISHNLTFAKVTIEPGADIGIGATILPGITVGEGAIVGAGAVVTKDVEAYSIVAGNPARLIRMRGGKTKQ